MDNERERYGVYGVWRDGVPDQLSTHRKLSKALRERDRRKRESSPRSAHFLVWDSHDPERGELDWDDESLIPQGRRLHTIAMAAVILLAGWLLIVLAGVLAGPA